jgi:hypothetical protein
VDLTVNYGCYDFFQIAVWGVGCRRNFLRLDLWALVSLPNTDSFSDFFTNVAYDIYHLYSSQLAYVRLGLDGLVCIWFRVG